MAIFEKETGSLGELVLEGLHYRPDAHVHGYHSPTVTELRLIVGAIAVQPEAVLYWDEPKPPRQRRENSMLRLRWMLACRANPRRIESANNLHELETLIAAAGLPAMGSNLCLPPPAAKIAFAVDRYLGSEQGPGHHRANTFGMVFRYCPPEGDDLAVLRARIEEIVI